MSFYIMDYKDTYKGKPRLFPSMDEAYSVATEESKSILSNLRKVCNFNIEACTFLSEDRTCASYIIYVNDAPEYRWDIKAIEISPELERFIVLPEDQNKEISALNISSKQNEFFNEDRSFPIMNDTDFHIIYKPSPFIPVGALWHTYLKYSIKCDGAEYLTSEYPELFEVIGYTYGGSGDYFRVPNLRGKGWGLL